MAVPAAGSAPPPSRWAITAITPGCGPRAYATTLTIATGLARQGNWVANWSTWGCGSKPLRWLATHRAPASSSALPGVQQPSCDECVNFSKATASLTTARPLTASGCAGGVGAEGCATASAVTTRMTSANAINRRYSGQEISERRRTDRCREVVATAAAVIAHAT
jgi:hypothetical protein